MSELSEIFVTIRYKTAAKQNSDLIYWPFSTYSFDLVTKTKEEQKIWIRNHTEPDLIRKNMSAKSNEIFGKLIKIFIKEYF